MFGRQVGVGFKTGPNTVLVDRYRATIAMAAVLLGLVVLGVIVSPEFRQWNNLVTVLRRSCVVAIAAAGCVFPLVTGGIDLSGGAVIGFAGTLAAVLAARGVFPPATIVVAATVGACAGAANGVVITKLNVNPFIATFGMTTILRGLMYPLTPGGSIYAGATNPGFLQIERALAAGVPVPIILMVAALAVCHGILSWTRFGKYCVVVGSGEAFAVASGVDVPSVKRRAYTLSGCMAGIAGAILASRMGMAAKVLGEGYELSILTAAILGGTRLGGGRGNIPGALIGSLIVGYLGNLLNVLYVHAYYQFIINGVVLLVAVLAAGLWRVGK